MILTRLIGVVNGAYGDNYGEFVSGDEPAGIDGGGSVSEVEDSGFIRQMGCLKWLMVVYNCLFRSHIAPRSCCNARSHIGLN